MKIKIGARYLCIRTVIMFGTTSDIRYIKNKIYKSEVEDAITDEVGEKRHYWLSPEEFNKFFIRIYNKRRRNKRKGLNSLILK